MYIKEILAVSKLPGLYKLVANRANGLIIEHILDGKRTFAASRNHQFNPLETIGVYTDDETIELKEVLTLIHQKSVETPPPDATADSQIWRSYFESLVSNYDQNQVSVSDMKRIVKWYHTLVKAGYHTKSEEEE